MTDPIIVSMKIPVDQMDGFLKNLDIVVEDARELFYEHIRAAATAVCALDWSDNDADAVALIDKLRDALKGEM